MVVSSPSGCAPFILVPSLCDRIWYLVAGSKLMENWKWRVLNYDWTHTFIKTKRETQVAAYVCNVCECNVLYASICVYACILANIFRAVYYKTRGPKQINLPVLLRVKTHTLDEDQTNLCRFFQKRLKVQKNYILRTIYINLQSVSKIFLYSEYIA